MGRAPRSLRRNLPAQLLDGRPTCLCLEPPFDGCTRGLGFLARLGWWFGGLEKEFSEPDACIGAVLFLCAEAPGLDDNMTFLGRATAGQQECTLAHVLRQVARIGGVKAELHGGRHLVDVLPAGSGGTDELLLQFVFLDKNAGPDDKITV